MEMVISEWLLDCAAEGRRVQEGLHRPDGDVTLLELPAAGPTQAPGGMTQMGVTQLQQTQTQVGGWVHPQALCPTAVLCCAVTLLWFRCHKLIQCMALVRICGCMYWA
jgi:hypothetical protein